MNENNKDILISLLESILNIKIKDIKYLNLEKNNGNIHVRRKHFDFHIKTDTENIHIEVNGKMNNYVRPRNMAYIANTYSREVLRGEIYNENIKFIQINFTYGLSSKSDNLRIYKLQDENNNTFVNNFVIYEFNMAYYMNLWYSSDERGINDNKYLIMMDLELLELEKLSKKDKVISKYMNELERINEDPEIYEYMSAEEDNRKIENSLKEQFREEGLEEGRKEGRKENSIEIAKKMLAKNMSLEDISSITELSIKDIKNLK